MIIDEEKPSYSNDALNHMAQDAQLYQKEPALTDPSDPANKIRNATQSMIGVTNFGMVYDNPNNKLNPSSHRGV